MFEDQLPQQLDSTVRPIRTNDRDGERGFALVLALLVVFVLSALITAYWMATMGEAKLAVSSTDSIHGQLAAEAGINLRCSAIRAEFEEWERPAGSPPGEPSVGELPCTQTTGTGSGAYECVTYPFAGRSAVTYVREEPGNPKSIIVPPGDRFANLSAEEWRYTVSSTAVNTEGFPEALLEMRWKTRNVPVFQMYRLYDQRPINWGQGTTSTVHGRLHTNAGMSFNASGDSIIYDGAISMAGTLEVRRASPCRSGDVIIDSNLAPSSPAGPPAGSNDNMVTLPWTCPGPHYPTQAQLDALGLDNVEIGADPVDFPPVESFDPPKALKDGTAAATPGGLYWEKADLRVVLTLRDLNNDGDTIDYAVNGVSESTYGVDFNYDGVVSGSVNDMREMWIEVRNPDNSVNVVATRRLTDPRVCPGQWNESPNAQAANRPVGPEGGTHPAAVWYTYEKTYTDDNWKWENSSGSLKKRGLYDWLERQRFGGNAWITMLEVDMNRIWDCLQDADVAGEDILHQGRHLDDDTNGGLVWYLTVDGPTSDSTRSLYGVRLSDGHTLHSADGSVPRPIGLTVVTDQGLYIKDDYNTTDWIPAAVISDHAAWLSNDWADDNYSTLTPREDRDAASTTMNVAFMAGSVTGVIGRYLEDWGGTTLTLNTSFVNLYNSRHTLAANTTANTYRPPSRNFDFDERFTQGQLPPMSPRFTYSRQEMFTRNFEW